MLHKAFLRNMIDREWAPLGHTLRKLHIRIWERRALKRNNKFWEELITYFPWYDTSHIENDASNNSSIVACVLVTAVTLLPSRCLATIWGFFNSPNPSSRTKALESTQLLTEMGTRNLPGGKGRPARKADNLTAIFELRV
jgi:hypothetical protein